jgi:hypothetical protein
LVICLDFNWKNPFFCKRNDAIPARMQQINGTSSNGAWSTHQGNLMENWGANEQLEERKVLHSSVYKCNTYGLP